MLMCILWECTFIWERNEKDGTSVRNADRYDSFCLHHDTNLQSHIVLGDFQHDVSYGNGLVGSYIPYDRN